MQSSLPFRDSIHERGRNDRGKPTKRQSRAARTNTKGELHEVTQEPGADIWRRRCCNDGCHRGIHDPTGDSPAAQLNPADVRDAAFQVGFDSLKNVIVNDPGGLTDFLRNGVGPGGIDPAARQAAIQLGKALFWDRQIGSDGQSCASCHFRAGADHRTRNQLSPNQRNTDPEERVTFDRTAAGGLGPNYNITAADFPFHQMVDPLEENYIKREVTFDTDDVMSSQGSFSAAFNGVPAPNVLFDKATPLADQGGFQMDADPGAGVNMVNVRRVEPRNTPSTINALFNFHNFWDGRANFSFNGKDPLGPLSLNPFIWANAGGVLTQIPTGGVGIMTQASLASQAVGPVLSIDEMSFVGRTFPDVGRKILQGPTVYSSYAPDPPPATPDSLDPTQTRRPLQFQEVADTDSHLSPLLLGQPVDRPGAGAAGLQLTFPTATITTYDPTRAFPAGTTANMPMYQALIQIAFQPRWWDAPQTGTVDPFLNVPQQQRINGYTLMETNFSLFFGIAVQLYEQELRADQSAFDLFMAGDDTFGSTGKGAAYGITDSELQQARLRGLLTFIKTDLFFQQRNPVFNGIRQGACVFCHGGPEMTNASLAAAGAIIFEIQNQNQHGRLIDGANHLGFMEDAFSNLGVRPSREDLGRAGSENNFPLSPIEAFFQGTPGAGILPPVIMSPNPFRRLIDGTFKVPLLRNVELTAPYFHNGGELTLAQSVEFYVRAGNFVDVNVKDVEPSMAASLMDIEGADSPFLVHFLLSLTDERVRFERAPFDHPQLQVPNGHPVATQELAPGVTVAADELLIIPAVGAEGRAAPITNFLGISSTPVPGPNNDYFDPQPPVAP